MITPATDTAIAHAATLLREGKLVAFPTETVYGLGADATNEQAVRRIFTVKGRPTNNPLIVHVPSFEELMHYVDFSRASHPAQLTEWLSALQPLWPGPLSVVVPKTAAISPAASAGGDTVALRIPHHPVALRLLESCTIPIAAPSANPSTYISPTTAQHVESGLGDDVACILDGGPCQVGLESTVVSLIHDHPRILRPGAITAQQLRDALRCDVDEYAPRAIGSMDPAPLLSPGLLSKHYAPRTRVILKHDVSSLGPLPPRIGCILFSDHPTPCQSTITKVISQTGKLEEIATRLFAALRELDQENLDLIVVDTCEPIGLGVAIMDRLVRAAT